jgi:hypothetical protein
LISESIMTISKLPCWAFVTLASFACLVSHMTEKSQQARQHLGDISGYYLPRALSWQSFLMSQWSEDSVRKFMQGCCYASIAWTVRVTIQGRDKGKWWPWEHYLSCSSMLQGPLINRKKWYDEREIFLWS